MSSIKYNVMRRIERIYLFRKIGIKSIILAGTLVLTQSFISVPHILANSLKALDTFNVVAIGEFVLSMLTHTELATHIVMAIMTLILILIIRDIRSVKSYKIEIR